MVRMLELTYLLDTPKSVRQKWSQFARVSPSMSKQQY